MSHSYVNNLMHCTFSTIERYPFIEPTLEADLWPYIGGIARANRMKALAIGGTADHIHALLSLSVDDEFCQGSSVDQRRVFKMDT